MQVPLKPADSSIIRLNFDGLLLSKICPLRLLHNIYVYCSISLFRVELLINYFLPQ